MEAGALSARDLTARCLARIDALDAQGPSLGAVLEVNPEALEIAAALDEERAAGEVRGPLHGLPVLLKDNIATADRMTTTAGSLALVGFTAPRDAALVERLRAAGAVILGKTNLSEWANFRSTRSSSGWSGRGGQCRNPYALDRSPCGSSSGSAAAVAAGMAPLAVGTETDGSIVCPASTCGIVGVKPTVGRISRRGVIPLAHSQDTAGPMALTVADAAALLTAMSGPDPADPITADAPEPADFAEGLAGATLRGARIGVARSAFGFDGRVDAVIEVAIAAMAAQGAQVVDPVEIAEPPELGRAEFEVLLYEFKADLDAWLAGLGEVAPAKDLASLIAWNQEHAETSMPWFGQELFEMALTKGPLTDDAYLEARETARRLAGPEGIDAAMDRHDLDALVGPSNGPAWVIDLVNGDHFGGGSSTWAAVSGYPNVTVPAGFVAGLPIGISFFGRAWSEGRLLKLAHAFEQATRHRRPPTFPPTLR